MKKYTFYALKDGNEIVYIGRTGNLKSRLYTHNKKGEKKFDNHEILWESTCSKRTACELEDFFIINENPKYNKSLNSKGEYLNLDFYCEQNNLDKSLYRKILDLAGKKPFFNNNYNSNNIYGVDRSLWLNKEYDRLIYGLTLEELLSDGR